MKYTKSTFVLLALLPVQAFGQQPTFQCTYGISSGAGWAIAAWSHSPDTYVCVGTCTVQNPPDSPHEVQCPDPNMIVKPGYWGQNICSNTDHIWLRKQMNHVTCQVQKTNPLIRKRAIACSGV
jgi:hypothetical protein